MTNDIKKLERPFGVRIELFRYNDTEDMRAENPRPQIARAKEMIRAISFMANKAFVRVEFTKDMTVLGVYNGNEMFEVTILGVEGDNTHILVNEPDGGIRKYILKP